MIVWELVSLGVCLREKERESALKEPPRFLFMVSYKCANHVKRLKAVEQTAKVEMSPNSPGN